MLISWYCWNAVSLSPYPTCQTHGWPLSSLSPQTYTLWIDWIDYRLLNPLQTNIGYYWDSVTIMVLHELNHFPPATGYPVFPVESRCDRLRFPFQTVPTCYGCVLVGRSDSPEAKEAGRRSNFLSATRFQSWGAIFGLALSSLWLKGMDFHLGLWVQVVWL